MDALESNLVLKMLDHHTVFIFLVQIAVLLAAARLLGELMQKLGQSAVIGELAAGVLLGPSFLGRFFPEFHAKLFPHEQLQADLLAAISWIGVIFLLIVIGLETDLNLIKRKGKKAMSVSAGGILVTFITGFSLGWLLPDVYLANPEQRLVFSLFMAVAMSISAVPVIAKVLLDMKLIRRDIGQVILAAGMTDDTIGWILLSVVAGMATKGVVSGGDVLLSVVVAVGLIIFGLTIGTKVVSKIISFVDSYFGGVTNQFSTMLVLAFGAAAFTHLMGIEAVLGAFIIGVLVGQSPRFKKEVAHSLEITTSGFVAPIFFAAAGLRVDLIRLADPEIFLIGILVLAIACIGKFIGAFIGAWAAGFSFWERLALGSGMNARGAMEIIVATVGLGLGVLTLEMYSIIVMVAIVTSLMAPPLLRWTLSHISIGDEEAERLKMEEFSETSFLYSVKRAMLVGAPHVTTHFAAKLLGKLSEKRSIEVSLLMPQTEESKNGYWKTSADSEDDLARLKSEIGEKKKIEVRHKSGESLPGIIRSEAEQDLNQLLIMGAKPYQAKDEGRLFGEIIDPVLLSSKNPCLIVDEARGGALIHQLMHGGTLKRILVPTTGTVYSTRALELASGIAMACDAKIDLVHVVNRQEIDHYLLSRQTEDPGVRIATDMVHLQAELARTLGARIEPHLIQGPSPEEEILKFAAENNSEIIILGSNLRAASDRAFLGHRLEHLIKHSSCPVFLLVS